ncbi:glycosyltransferase family 4 protein [Phycicoccus sonneratiae]|uniref:Glycosyltransferase family 4 protein n=1 Tax=Phycicoccus sonneratiae TaxID=2807628 RepID=A0ABS2CGZ2_9MICO|nr:glycosyltransferase family 4 protein [Phycicoccus sonneraticus]MBM6399141.1 glycosyltransferase family 4 protein [Phycicoccus sonneraticus]
MNDVLLAANNGEVGGGEVMLLATAEVLRDLGLGAEVVGPDAEGGVLDHAEAAGFPVHRLAADRRRYARELRDWHRTRTGLTWCHGLVPSLATAGRRHRVVHLHQLPSRAHRAALLAARNGASATLAPSRWLAARVSGAAVLPNWTADPGPVSPRPPHDGAPRLGFLGRHTVDKGLVVLAEALAGLPDRERPHLVLAGEPRFTDASTARRVAEALEPLGDGVERLGWVEPATLFAHVDGLVVPSVAPEAFGLSGAEAMAAGVPLLVTDAGALPELVGPDHPWVCAAGDADALRDTVTAWARTSRHELTSVAAAQRARWQDEYSPHAGRDRVATLLRDLHVHPA